MRCTIQKLRPSILPVVLGLFGTHSESGEVGALRLRLEELVVRYLGCR